MTNPQAPVDSRGLNDLVAEIFARHPGWVADWMPAANSAGNGLAWIAARYRQAVIQRLNQAPAKNRTAFFDLLGIGLVPARCARAPLVFQATPQGPDSVAPASTQVAAPPPRGGSAPLVFETEREVGIMAASLVQMVSLWSGRDQYLDHSSALASGTPVTLFDPLLMQPTPHAIYLAHDKLLALTGSVSLDVTFELSQPSISALELLWEYWDGVVWRGFKGMNPACAGIAEPRLDGTMSMTRSGTFHLQTDCAQAVKTTVAGINAYWIRGRLTQPLPPDPARVLPEVTAIRLQTSLSQPVDPIAPSGAAGTATPAGAQRGLLPDHAFVNETELDLTKGFYPFGQMPQPGIAFYFSSNEIFSKAGAGVEVVLASTQTPQDQVSADKSTELSHELAWEYWNGAVWTSLTVSTVPQDPTISKGDPSDLNATGQILFTVPDDMARTKVGGQDGLWMRARLASGGYGFTATIDVGTSGTSDGGGVAGAPAASFTYVVVQPPALNAFRLGYAWSDGPYFAEHVLTHNDFQFEDHTYEAQWPGNGFLPFHPVADVSPGLYLGFDRKLPVADLGLYFDIVEQPGDDEGPALVWEYWNGGGWIKVTATDETGNLRLPGIVSWIGADDSQALARFDAARFWLRARLKEDGPPGEPVVNAVMPNAVWASQQQTVNDLALGASSGLPEQIFVITQIPVLDGERIEVQELAGARANVEWRILAASIVPDDPDIVNTIERELGQEGPQTDFVHGDLRVVRDRNKLVSQVWVCWHGVPYFYLSQSADRHYVIDAASGRVLFGDNVNGKIPAAGSLILAKQFRTGGGSAGNVDRNTITQLLGSLQGVQAAANVRAAEGGSDGETPRSFDDRAPGTLRSRGRAITTSDYETLAREASSAVAVAHAVATRDSNGRTRPGWITLLILPASQAPRPTPSFGLRDEVSSYIKARMPADLVAGTRLIVSGPNYVGIDVSATLTPLDPSLAWDVEQSALTALGTFLHPLTGGPEGNGWLPGRGVYLSDVAAALRGLPGLDYLEELALLRDGVPQGDSIVIAADCTVAAGQLRINIKAAAS
ncbi:putative baseplate assembly protein [Burkholderia sp. Ax-1735]|nr:putative baseplate assembly protein [Burkholderia sp. Ap-955]NIF10156.1 putative baseplate assembly protein [Burkholderia sp. Ax-1735]NIG03607.1 putative baseplate assembly protein [Burkholderia sp. Tr-849]